MNKIVENMFPSVDFATLKLLRNCQGSNALDIFLWTASNLINVPVQKLPAASSRQFIREQLFAGQLLANSYSQSFKKCSR